MNGIIKAFALMLSCAALFCGCTTTEITAPAGMKLASGEAADYLMYVPDAWITDVSTGTCAAYASASDPTNATLVRTAAEAELTAEAFWEQYKGDFETSFSSFEIISEGDNVTLGGREAKRYVYKASLTGTEYKYNMIICVTNNSVYMLTYTALTDSYDRNFSYFTMISDNFSFKTSAVG